MAFEFRWLASTQTSALHAVAAIVGGGTPTDPKLAAALADEANGWRDYLPALGEESLFEQLLALSASYDTPPELAEVALIKTFGPGQLESLAAPLAMKLRTTFAAYNAAFPDALEELEVRSRPLREQWEARGPGLLAAAQLATEPELIVERADAILVQPVAGGGGGAHPRYNSVRIEAVLANPIDALPEVVRLAWFVAQLNLDLPIYQGNLLAQRVKQLWPLAMIPPVLAAAQEVELARYDNSTLATALAQWLPASADPVDATLLARWWSEYQESQPDWDVALGALDQMLRGEG